MTTIKKSSGKGRRLKSGTKEYKSNWQKIEDRIDEGIDVSRHSIASKYHAEQAKKSLRRLRKIEEKDKAASVKRSAVPKSPPTKKTLNIRLPANGKKK